VIQRTVTEKTLATLTNKGSLERVLVDAGLRIRNTDIVKRGNDLTKYLVKTADPRMLLRFKLRRLLTHTPRTPVRYSHSTKFWSCMRIDTIILVNSTRKGYETASAIACS
jgi:hypothetical protein